MRSHLQRGLAQQLTARQAAGDLGNLVLDYDRELLNPTTAGTLSPKAVSEMAAEWIPGSEPSAVRACPHSLCARPSLLIDSSSFSFMFVSIRNKPRWVRLSGR
jgi:hypothetical protein